MTDAHFDVYGYRFSVCGNAEEALWNLAEDFRFFEREEAPGGVRIDLRAGPIPLENLPSGPAVAYTPRNVAYREGGKRFVDYHGRALGIQDEAAGNFSLYGEDSGLLYEAAYLYLLSQVGERLDSLGVHRIHAVALAVEGRAVLVMMPMGGGKSTLGLHAMKRPEVQILSDDSPFVGRDGRVLAYPLRLGLLPGSEGQIPAEHRRVIQRMEFGPKYLVNYSYFRDRVAESASPGLVFVGVRSMSADCRIEQIGRLAGMRSCIANCIVGVGLFQGIEFLVQSNVWELFGRVRVGLSRAWNCWTLLGRSRVCVIYLGRNVERNAQTLVDYATAFVREEKLRNVTGI